MAIKGTHFRALEREWKRGKVRPKTMLLALGEQMHELGDTQRMMATKAEELVKMHAALLQSAGVIDSVAFIVEAHSLTHLCDDPFEITPADAAMLERIAAGKSRGPRKAKRATR